LFDHQELQPKELRAITEKWEEIAMDIDQELTTAQCQEYLDEVEELGYTFDFDFMAEPESLTKKVNIA
jgi:hypothetical protein